MLRRGKWARRHLQLFCFRGGAEEIFPLDVWQSSLGWGSTARVGWFFQYSGCRRFRCAELKTSRCACCRWGRAICHCSLPALPPSIVNEGIFNERLDDHRVRERCWAGVERRFDDWKTMWQIVFGLIRKSIACVLCICEHLDLLLQTRWPWLGHHGAGTHVHISERERFAQRDAQYLVCPHVQASTG